MIIAFFDLCNRFENIAILSFTLTKRRKMEGKVRLRNEEACTNNCRLLRINGEKHDEMLLPLTPLSV
jgi:hypothetical protein